jgi:sulfate adenylyltransferase subunit 1
VVEQTRRHAAVAALLRVPHVVLAVNKMDLVDYAEPVFAAIAAEFTTYATALGVPAVTTIPISALVGDNVVEPSANMDWYGGPTVLEHLETVQINHDPRGRVARFPVQYVIRHHPDYRGYAGKISSGMFHVGQPVTVLPSGHTSAIAAIDVLGRPVDAAWASQSVTLRITDDIDISRGDMIVPADNPPPVTQDVTATVCHLHENPLLPGARVLLQHTTRMVRAIVKDITDRLTLDDLSHHPAPGRLAVNDIGRIVLRTSEPLPLDAYADCRRTGSFLLIDPADGSTLTAGMAGPALGAPKQPRAADEEWDF